MSAWQPRAKRRACSTGAYLANPITGSPPYAPGSSAGVAHYFSPEWASPTISALVQESQENCRESQKREESEDIGERRDEDRGRQRRVDLQGPEAEGNHRPGRRGHEHVD